MAKVLSVVVRAGPPFNYDVEEASVVSGLSCSDKSLTLQSQKDDADINVIVKRFGIDGKIPQSLRLPTYQDFEGIFDFRSAMDAVNSAEKSFMEIPARVRGQFNNDPQEFVAFCSDPANLPKLRELGLAPAAKPDEAAQLEQEAEREARKADLVDKKRAKSKPSKDGGDEA